jgi:diguanylate cyclase (GGDEF)-like protein
MGFNSSFFDAKVQYGYYNLSEGWDVVNENEGLEFHDVSLWDINIGKAGNYKPVTMINTIPRDRIPAAAIVFRTYYCSVEVYIGGELKYTFAKDIMESGRMCPKHYNVIPVTADCLGKELKIVLIPNEVYSFSGLSPVYFGNIEDVYRSIIADKRLPLLIGTFLCIFGFAMFITSLYMLVYHKGSIALIFAANISFDMGTYILDFNDLYHFISDADRFYTFIEYLSLYFIPLSIIVFLITSNSYFRNWIFYLCTVVDALFVIYTTVVHCLNIDHICNYLSVVHVIGFVEGILFIGRLIISIYGTLKSKKNDDITLGAVNSQSLISSIVFLIGVLIYLVCIFIDMALYLIKTNTGVNYEMNKEITFFIIGSLCFVLAILLNYFFISIEHISMDRQNRQLEGIAYTDELTGLSNRARCELELASIKKKNREGFSVISIDVDKLKTVNDTLGHNMGDALIKEFADAFAASVNDADLLGRMGGDEFIAIYKKGSESICKSAMERLVKEIEKRNAKDNRAYDLSFSYGYACSSNSGNINPRDIYMEADKNMYEMKKIHHKEGACL